jgi:hypothetical protein
MHGLVTEGIEDVIAKGTKGGSRGQGRAAAVGSVREPSAECAE